MSADEPPEKFDVSVEPAPQSKVIAAEPADDEEKRRQDAALASTYDPDHTKDGKTDEELIEELHAADLLAVDVALAAGVVIAVHEAHTHGHGHGHDHEQGHNHHDHHHGDNDDADGD